MDDEYWVPIIGFDKFVVSNLGRVKNIVTGNIYKPYKRKDGYLQVSIPATGFNRNNVTTRTIHSLVSDGFLSRPIWGTQINHIDGNKNNNRVSNLEWTTSKLNICRAHIGGLHKWTHVLEVHDITTNEIVQYNSLYEFARAHELTHSEASIAVRLRKKRHLKEKYRITSIRNIGQTSVRSIELYAVDFTTNTLYRASSFANLAATVSRTNTQMKKAMLSGKVTDGIFVWAADDKSGSDRVNLITQEEIDHSINKYNSRFLTKEINYDLKNYVTGEIVTLYTYQEVAKKIGVGVDTLTKHIQYRKDKLLLGWYIKHGYIDNGFPPFDTDAIQLSLLSTGVPEKPFKLIDNHTNEVTYWKSANSLAKAWGRASSVTDLWVKKQNVPGHTIILL